MVLITPRAMVVEMANLKCIFDLLPLFLVEDVKGHDFSDLSGVKILWVIRGRRGGG